MGGNIVNGIRLYNRRCWNVMIGFKIVFCLKELIDKAKFHFGRKVDFFGVV